MVKNHLKRLTMPISWPVLRRKGVKFIAKPLAGAHKMELSIPIVVILRDMLNYAETMKEVKLILNNETILVNGKKVEHPKFNCGLFDVLTFEKLKKSYILVYDKYSKFNLVEYSLNKLYLRVLKKNLIKGDKYSLSFTNSYNIIVNKKVFDSVKIKDTVIMDIKTKKIDKVLNLKEGSFVYVYKGKFVSQIGKVIKIDKYNGLSVDLAELEDSNGKFITALSSCFVIGSSKKDTEWLS